MQVLYAFTCPVITSCFRISLFSQHLVYSFFSFQATLFGQLLSEVKIKEREMISACSRSSIFDHSFCLTLKYGISVN